MYSLSAAFLFFVLVAVDSARILGVFQFPSLSHQIVFRALCRELSLRGHQVTIVTSSPLRDKSLVNLTEIDISSAANVLPSSESIEFTMSKDMPTTEIMISFYDLSEKIQEAVLQNEEFQKLYNDPKAEFDLLISEALHPGMYSLAGRFNVPVIGMSSLGVVTASHESVGNIIHPVLYPDMNLPYVGRLTLKEKLYSIYFTMWSLYYYNFKVIPRADMISRKYLGDQLPYLGDIGRNVSLLLINTNMAIYGPRPHIPTVIPLGFTHIQPVKPLPKDLQSILDSESIGAVYFSLGSNVKSCHLSPHILASITKVLSEIPYTVFWKWEGDKLPKSTDNIIYRKWFPQRDLLAHPNIKLFITQGGLQSIEEAILSEVPMVGMPFIGDQAMNVKRIAMLGIGVEEDPSKITATSFRNSIFEVIRNSTYKKRIKEWRHILEDQPMSSMEKAIFWTEYVIRHKGAPHLRAPTLYVPWWEYFLFDAIGFALLMCFVIVYVIFKCLLRLPRIFKHDKLKTT
ncbi:unnamed protein product [Callosobruchus maculatus]|uniref:UDP-glucuronosyltransferase n=1 Tax=Callosobruchus maculatus TaxID=64391 RepID=A0A653CN07_CALMS|nr:unnamed protein product [Callosobruchus maculatus]